MHELKETKIEWFTQHKYKIGGIIHVGANVGQEIPWYLHKLYLPILVFEPHPIAFEELKRIYGQYVNAIPVALGDKNEMMTLHIPSDGNHERSSKYHPVETVGHDWTKVPMSEEIQVPVLRFDAWVKLNQEYIDLTAYDTLVVDVQGMELEVLRGFGKLLNGFHFLCVECSATPMYDGEAWAEEIIQFTFQHGFGRITPIEEHDDILFKRMREM
jgi:FkbM family methyltransferase